jgi:hypothetical protein
MNFYIVLLLLSIKTISSYPNNEYAMKRNAYDEYTCEIANQKHKREYLHAADSALYRRDAFISPCYRPFAWYTREYMCDEESLVWSLTPAPDEKNTFFIKNKKYGEYLYATNSYVGLGNEGRPVYTWKASRKNDFLAQTEDKADYLWHFRKSPTGLGYIITSVKYDERKFLFKFV